MQVKATTKFSKIFDAYAGKKGIEAANIKFLYDGQRIRDHQTPAELGIEVGNALFAFKYGLPKGIKQGTMHLLRHRKSANRYLDSCAVLCRTMTSSTASWSRWEVARTDCCNSMEQQMQPHVPLDKKTCLSA